jgi:hypothetical protein
MSMIRRTVSGRRALAAAAGALVAVTGLAGALAAGPAASASPVARTTAATKAPTWKMQAPPEPTGATDLNFYGVSCSSSSACLAVAYHGLDDPSGYGSFAETWNGSHWAVRTVPHPQAAYLYGVSCRSARWCVAVGTLSSGDDHGAIADRWNGSTWTQARAPITAGATISALVAVSCSSTTACTAVGDSGKGSGLPGLLADRWNGSAWKMQRVPAPRAGAGVLNAVACPAADACRAVGSDKTGALAEAWNGSSWKIIPVPVPAGGSHADLKAISCAAAGSCEAVGTYDKGNKFLPLAEVWNGSRWRAQAPPTIAGATATELDAVSCVSATDCEAGGQINFLAGLLEKWNGTKWSVQEKVLPAGGKTADLSGISCTTGPVCEAVGDHGPTAGGDQLLALRYSS